MKENNKILYICILYKNTKKNIAMTKGRKTIIELGLLGVIVILIFLIYNSIKTNIDFENEKNRKIELVKTKLMNARELQYAYERKHREYCNDWDKLTKFALEDSLEFERKIGNLEDSVEVAEGRAYIEKVQIPVIQKLTLDSVFTKNFDIHTLKYIPETDSVFEIAASSVIAGGVKLPTFQIGVDFSILLHGLDPQLIQNAKENFEKRTGYPGIRVGKIDHATTEGNWE